MSCNYNCNNKPTPAPNNTCGSTTSNCCTGLTTPKFNVAKAQTICGYINRIFDEQIGTGTALFATLQSTLPNYSVTTVLTNPNTACCQPCQLGSGAIFTLNNCTTSKLITLVPTTTIVNTQVLVNGVAAPSVSKNTDGTYTINVSSVNGIPSTYCSLPNTGTPSTIMIQNAGPWEYTTQYDFYGLVNYNGQNCNFHTTVANITPSTIPNNSTSTIMIQKICIPSSSSLINISINGSLSLISPVLSYDTLTSSVIATGNEVIVPQITAEVLQPTKVCVQAMM